MIKIMLRRLIVFPIMLIAGMGILAIAWLYGEDFDFKDYLIFFWDGKDGEIWKKL